MKPEISAEFMALIDVPKFVQPFIDRLFDEQEVHLLLAMRDDRLSVVEVAGRLNLSLQQTQSRLEHAYSRSVVNREVSNGAAFYSALRFYDQLDTLSTFENLGRLPEMIRRKLSQWQFDIYVESRRQDVERKKREGADSVVLGNDVIMLLDELEEVIDAAAKIIVLPCDGRSVNGHCQRSEDFCVWMDGRAETILSKGKGRKISKEEAHRIVKRADQDGLMHTVNGDWRTSGPTEICNCCSCDCYPFRASRVLGAKGIWPRSRYIARYDEEICVRCGRCTERCHFKAFVRLKGNGIGFDANCCWGCGLCENTCTADAIIMEPLGGEQKWL